MLKSFSITENGRHGRRGHIALLDDFVTTEKRRFVQNMTLLVHEEGVASKRVPCKEIGKTYFSGISKEPGRPIMTLYHLNQAIDMSAPLIFEIF